MDNLAEQEMLRAWGYESFFAAARATVASLPGVPARVVAEHRGVYRVRGTTGELSAKVTGKRMFEASGREDYPAVGDWVIIELLGEGQATIHDILPRKTVLKKKYNAARGAQVIAANIDVALIVESVDRDFSLNRFERYVVLAREGGITPVIVLNKIDLLPEAEVRAHIEAIKERFEGIDVISTSATSASGLDTLRVHLAKGKTYCFLGSSGVGKSSLINKLLGRDDIRTGAISDTSGRGTHTTTSREMYFLEGGAIVIDNPGTREVGLVDVKAGIEAVFDEVSALAAHCQYRDCSHNTEPDCAVQAALQSGALDHDAYDNYVRLKKEAEFADMDDRARREKDRRFGKMVKQAKVQLKKRKPGHE